MALKRSQLVDTSITDVNEPRPKKNQYDVPIVEMNISTPTGSRITLVNRDIGGLITALKISKSLYDQAGQWQVTVVIDKENLNSPLTDGIRVVSEGLGVKPNSDLEDFLIAKSYVQLKINNVVQMVGILDNYTKTVQIGQSKKIMIQGRDMGGLLIDFKRWWTFYQNSPINNPGLISRQLQYDAFSDNIQGIFEGIFNNWMGLIYTDNEVDVGFHIDTFDGQTRSITDILKIVQIPAGADQEEYDSAMAVNGNLYTNDVIRYFGSYNNDGDFFTIFEQFISRPFNEMWVTSGGRKITLNSFLDGDVDQRKLDDSKAYLVVRPSPYDTNFNKKGRAEQFVPLLQLEALERIVITDDVIYTKSLTRGDKSKLYSTYSVLPSGINYSPSALEPIIAPIWDLRIFKKYGYNPLKVIIDSMAKSNSNVGKDFDDNSQLYQGLLFNWFRFNDENLIGSFMIEGNEFMREGICLDYRKTRAGEIDDAKEERLYYVNGYEQNWQFGKSFTTTVNVEHGIKDYQEGLP